MNNPARKLFNKRYIESGRKSLINKKFNYQITNFVDTTYTMVGANDKPRPHKDKIMGVTHQCLIYMHGPESVNNGTGFYNPAPRRTLSFFCQR